MTIALDFGTSTTFVADRTGVVPIGSGMAAAMPSVVGYAEDGSLVVGEDAEIAPPGQVVRSVKRAITERRDFVAVELTGGVRDVGVDDLVGHMLHEVVRRGAARGRDLSAGTVRLGCPAMWDGRQRRRLLDAAQRAGMALTMEGLVDEPVAAGIAWLAAHPFDSDAPMRVLVFDMGGGTLDIAVLDVRGPNHHEISVLAAVGVAEGGDALDESLADDLDFMLAREGVDLLRMPRSQQLHDQLVDAARTAKVRLSQPDVTEVPIVLPPAFGAVEIWYERDRVEAVFQRQMERAEHYVAAALRVARLTELVGRSATDIARSPIDALVADIDLVLLSGGMTQLPYVEQRLRWLFPETTRIERAAIPPDQAVVLGLARAGNYGRINMYRPAFDVVLDWSDGRGFRTVYEAFTPLVEAAQVAPGGGDLRFVRTASDLGLPREGTGRLRVVSYADSRIRATVGGAKLDGLQIGFCDQFEFSVYPNGRIRITDATGVHEGQIEDWHTIT